MSIAKVGWGRLQDWAQEYGDSFYVLDLGRFAANYRRLEEAFRAGYPRSRIAYSYKTNYTPVLCEWVDRRGGYAEVVSGAEYALARRIGVEPSRIIFNGPYKRESEFERALLEGAQVNLDGERELEMLEVLARQFPDALLRVGLRCSFPLEGGMLSRFGFGAEEGQLRKAAERVRACGADLEAVHCHFSWGSRSAEAYGERMERLLGVCSNFFGKAGPSRVDIGGGFFSPMDERLRVQFDGAIPSFEQYAEAVTDRIRKAYPFEGGPELVLEPGSALVSDAMWLVARVMDCRQSGGRTLAVTAGSVHTLKPTRHSKEMPVDMVHQVDGVKEGGCDGCTDLVGYTCMEGDYLARGVRGHVAPGDFAVFGNVGAYTSVMKPPFIQPSPAILVVSEDGRMTVAKRQAGVSEFFHGYESFVGGFGVE
jgi:diaminopimelate decarboxylase